MVEVMLYLARRAVLTMENITEDRIKSAQFLAEHDVILHDHSIELIGADEYVDLSAVEIVRQDEILRQIRW